MCIRDRVQTQEVLLCYSALTIGLECLDLLDIGQAGQAVVEHVQQGVQDGIKETLPTTIHPFIMTMTSWI